MKITTAFAATALAAAFAAPAAALPGHFNPSALVIFGDSLVDAGNIDVAVGSDFFNPVARGYFPGRFTNGPDYTDLLSLTLYGSLTAPSLLGGNNFAFGGARAVDNSAFVPGADPVPDLGAQVATYGARVGGIADPNALYIINVGGNDIFGILTGNIGGLPPSVYEAQVAASIAGSVAALNAAGARHFLVTGIPVGGAAGFATEFQLGAALGGLTLAPGTTLTRFSYLGFFAQALGEPTSLGIAPYVSSGNCIDERVAIAGHIDCTGYFSFDGTHPTADIQRALFNKIGAATGITAVPEPQSWALLIAGFGLTGAALRRRRVAAA